MHILVLSITDKFSPTPSLTHQFSHLFFRRRRRRRVGEGERGEGGVGGGGVRFQR